MATGAASLTPISRTMNGRNRRNNLLGRALLESNALLMEAKYSCLTFPFLRHKLQKESRKVLKLGRMALTNAKKTLKSLIGRR